MNTRTKNTPPKGSKTIAACCTDAACDSGRRNRYFAGKRMTPDAFRVEQGYEIERRRLLNRAIHGSGVVYGFGIGLTPPDHCTDDGARRLQVRPGLALDKCGRELLQADTIELDLGDILTFDRHGCPVAPANRKCDGTDSEFSWTCGEEDCWLLSIHYAERLIAPVTLPDPCECDRHEWDQVCETVRYSLRRIPCRECCAEPCCELHCACATGKCCGEKMVEDEDEKEAYAEHDESQHRDDEPVHGAVVRRGGCRCLCDYLTELDPNPEDCKLCEIKKGLWVDFRHGIPLACVRLIPDNCGYCTFHSIVDDCGPRPLVKRNDLLFDLIRGCDLTHISRIGWAGWHRARESVPWEEFRNSFRGNHDGHPGSKYWIEFSKPVRSSTVRTDCFVVRVITATEEGGWGEPLRVPIIRIHKEHRQGDPEHTIRSAVLVFDPGWVHDEIDGQRTIFKRKVQMEFEIRGDFIEDCNRLCVDVHARGASPGPTGSGAPGGIFFSNFPVGPQP
jgi:hypothetical protein